MAGEPARALVTDQITSSSAIPDEDDSRRAMAVRDAVQFCHGESLNQDWRTGTLLIHLNLDIHKCWNVIMPYSEEFHWGAIPFCEVLFSRQF